MTAEYGDDLAEATPDDANVAMLISSASVFMRGALSARRDEDFVTASTLAPIAVEHLGKGLLWAVDPALLTPLAADSEDALFHLVDSPQLTDSGLRTVGLAHVLTRLESVLPRFPLNTARAGILTDVRDGAVYVGTDEASLHVLQDALLICEVLLDVLECAATEFYGDQGYFAARLLDSAHSYMNLLIEARAKAAIDRLDLVESPLAPGELEAQDPTAGDPATVAVSWSCVACGGVGRLLGTLEANQASSELESDDLNWVLTFTAQAFTCQECQFSAKGHGELLAGALPSTRYRVDEASLGPRFDLEMFMRNSSPRI